MSHVFVSYSHQDNDFAQLLRTHLEQEGIKTWLALENLKAGEQWREGIDDAIRASYAVIVVISPPSDSSKYVTYEWAFAYGIGRQIIPLLHKEVSTKIHPRLENLQYEDFTHTNNRPWDRLIKRLHEIQKLVSENERRDPKIDEAIRTLRTSFKPQERAEAAKALGIFRAKSSIPTLLENLNDPEEAVQLSIVRALGDIQDNLSVPSLIELINGTTHSKRIRIAAIQSIAKIGDVSASDEILNLLHNSNKDIVEAAIDALGSFGAPTLAQPLIDFLNARIERYDRLIEDAEEDYSEDNSDNLDDEFILLAFNALQKNITPEHLNIISPLLSHKNVTIRKRVVEIIGQMEVEETSPYLVQIAIKDANNALRGIAISGLAKLDKTKPIKEKLADLGSEDGQVGKAAIDYFEETLGFDGLLLCLSEQKSKVYWTVCKRIENRAIDDGAEKVRTCLTNNMVLVRAFAADIIGNLGERGCCDDLKPLIDDQSAFVRGLAIRAVGKLQCKGIVRILQSKLDDKEKIFSDSTNTVADFAAIALGKLKHKAAIPFLVDILKSSKNDLHMEAGTLLGNLNATTSVLDLRELLSGNNPSIQTGALIALGFIEHEANVSGLLSDLNSDEESG